MRALARIALTLSSIAAANASAATPADYAYTFPIETDTAAPASSAWRVELTADAYAWLQDALLRDAEVFNAAGAPVPMAQWHREPAFVTHERMAALPVLALPASAPRAPASDLRLVIDRGSDGRLRRIDAGEQTPAEPDARLNDWVLDASAFDHPIDRIVLGWSTPASGIVARFGIEASDDLQSWHSSGGGTVLALEQDGSRLERHDIDLAGVRAKYLRLHRLDDGEPLTSLTVQARASERNAAETARVWVDATIAARSEATTTAPGGVTRYDYELPSALPVDVIRVELASDNALAPLALSARAPGSPGTTWNELARITAFRLRPGEETLRNGDIQLSTAPRRREFRIESGVPLAAPPRLAIGYHPDALVFLAEGNGPYTLAVGSVRAEHAQYPVDAALVSLRSRLGKDWQPPLARLGAGKESGGRAALTQSPIPTPWSRWLLWGVLVAAAVVVGGIAVNLLRGVGR
jgi:hypothetical protein